MISFSLNYPLNVLSPRTVSHIGRTGLQHMNWGLGVIMQPTATRHSALDSRYFFLECSPGDCNVVGDIRQVCSVCNMSKNMINAKARA